ncbi:MAG: alternate F1F0 ATPase, F1 subunit alpha [Deltaproteobacteria bacterium]|nr:alternate F1F0 ATPase, F1 subunit alpha [Deltaproteobacteria bacterium]
METDTLVNDSSRVFAEVLKDFHPDVRLKDAGTLIYLNGGIARLSGLPGVQSNELVRFPGGVFGIAFNLDPDEVGVIMLGASGALRVGCPVRRTGRVLDAPVGEELLGRVIDFLGTPLDNLGPLHVSLRRPVEREAPAIMHRAPVTVPLQTGIKVVDALIPIGRGQRQLIIGDRQSGKTSLILDTIINQKGKDVICVYCAIGQQGSSVAKLTADLARYDAMGHCILVVADGSDPAGLQYVTPYAATTMAEYFMEQGRDVLIIYDDLTRHSRAYRELSLLLRRPPGREAFPGDIFYIHSRLLERSTHLDEAHGGGSLTALPVIETEAQNLSAYIPTNLISITDGQIYLSPDLYQKGVLPAVDVGKSVSRVGGKTQLPAYRSVAGDLRLSYAQFEEMEAFSRFSSRLDDAARQILERGRRVRETLKQRQYDPMPVCEQVAVLVAVTNGMFDALPPEQVAEVEQKVRESMTLLLPDLCVRIEAGEDLDERDRERILAVISPLVTPAPVKVRHADP